MCQLSIHQDMKHLGSLESTQKVRVDELFHVRIFCALQTSRMLHNNLYE